MRHIVALSGGKDSTAMAVKLQDKPISWKNAAICCRVCTI